MTSVYTCGGLPPDDQDDIKTIRTEIPSAPKLRANLIKDGWVPKSGDAAHHIVAGNAKRSAAARAILKRYNIGINDSVNGVFLPHNARVSGSVYHRSIHTKTYYREVNTRLSQATNRNEALQILRGIRSDITYNIFPI